MEEPSSRVDCVGFNISCVGRLFWASLHLAGLFIGDMYTLYLKLEASNVRRASAVAPLALAQGWARVGTVQYFLVALAECMTWLYHF